MLRESGYVEKFLAKMSSTKFHGTPSGGVALLREDGQTGDRTDRQV